MKIAISGSVGVGKTALATKLSEKLKFEVVHLNEIAQKFKLSDIKELQTFDFDVQKCIDYIEDKYKLKDNIIFEGHFAHLLHPKFIDFIVIINRDLKELHQEYINREYNTQKITDNLEVESLNVCFYEAEEEGYEEDQFIVIENTHHIDIEDIVNELKSKIERKKVVLQKIERKR